MRRFLTRSPDGGGQAPPDLSAHFQQSVSAMEFRRTSSTTSGRGAGHITAEFAVSTDATRQGRVRIAADGFNGSGSEGVRVEGDGSAAGTKLGFYAAPAQAQQTVTGSRGGNAALASLLTVLASLGLIVDGSTP